MSARGCQHCGEPLPRGMETFCCVGCEAAARWIVDAGLGDYYRIRESAPRGNEAPRDVALWDRPELVARYATGDEERREIVLLIEGMHCAACAWLIERALGRVRGVLEAEAAFARSRVRIAWRPSETGLGAVVATLDRLGYRAHLPASREAEAARAKEARRELVRVGVAGICAMQAMMFSEALTLGFGLDDATRTVFRWLALLASSPAVIWCASPIWRGALREWRLRSLGMDTPVAASIAIAFLASVWSTIAGGAEVWFDAASMFAFLVLGARALESRQRRRAQDGIELNARAQPEFCERAIADGSFEAVPVEALVAGDVVTVRPGGVVPADGVALERPATVDEAWLTGEPRPLCKPVGSPLRAGSVCVAAPLVMRVEAVGSSTLLSQLQRLVERAASRRPRAAQRADRAAALFVTVVVVAAVATLLFWLGADPSRALGATIAVLVISCPCALALAVPAALAAASARLARAGVLVAGADAIEKLAAVGHVALDKTGTLTRGAPALLATETAGDPAQMRAIAAALERGSLHPIARAFAPFDDGRVVEHARETAGEGVEGRIDGRAYRLGRSAGAALVLREDARELARFDVDDAPRADARATCDALRALGLELELLSGDLTERVSAVAARAGVTRWRAAMSPAAKLERVRELQAGGARVAMVGDGINDAPVLAGADVAIALGHGAPAAQQVADVVLPAQGLARVADAIELARAAERVVRQNLAWALAYNFVAIPFAAAGLVSPWIAALGMTASSLVVTLNSARLARWTLRSDRRDGATVVGAEAHA